MKIWEDKKNAGEWTIFLYNVDIYCNFSRIPDACAKITQKECE
jgi:hypothetical protein